MNPEYVLTGIAILITCLIGAWQFWPSIESRKFKSLFVVAMLAISGVTLAFMFKEEKEIEVYKEEVSKDEKSKKMILGDLYFVVPEGWKKSSHSSASGMVLENGDPFVYTIEPISLGELEPVISISFMITGDPYKIKEDIENGKEYFRSPDFVERILNMKEVAKNDGSTIEKYSRFVSKVKSMPVLGESALTFNKFGLESYDSRFFLIEGGLIYIVIGSTGGSQKAQDRLDKTMQDVLNSVRINKLENIDQDKSPSFPTS